MDRLEPNQALEVNQTLRSNNGRYTVLQQADGNLVLYENGEPVWASGRAGVPIVRTGMQADGNLVSVGADGTPYWHTNTWNHSGASALIQDDGNFVIYDPRGAPLWASNDFHFGDPPATPSSDSRGYGYVQVTRWWRQLCSGLPCCLQMQWPGYATTKVEANIDGVDVVIQLWKGWCAKFAGNETFPGGAGLEVGIYRRDAVRTRLAAPAALVLLEMIPFPGLGLGIATQMLLSPDDFWWPCTDRSWRIDATYVNPVTGEPVFQANEQETWWRTKWMNRPSYDAYRQSQGGRLPPGDDGFRLRFSVNGRQFDPW